MATIYKEIAMNVASEKAWAALKDFGAVHEKLAPGFLTDCKVEPGARVVTFFNGATAREVLVGMDEKAKRLAYTVVGGRATHHNASAQIVDNGDGRTRFIWITDVLPDEFANVIEPMMNKGAEVMKATLERKP